MKTVTLRASSVRSILLAINTHIEKLTSEGVNYNKLRPFILAGKEMKLIDETNLEELQKRTNELYDFLITNFFDTDIIAFEEHAREYAALTVRIYIYKLKNL